jgi:hypothetical protein
MRTGTLRVTILLWCPAGDLKHRGSSKSLLSGCSLGCDRCTKGRQTCRPCLPRTRLAACQKQSPLRPTRYSVRQAAASRVTCSERLLGDTPGHQPHLLDHLPPKMHLVILTRADPPLALARLRARDQLTEIGADHLRFTPDEATAFLNQLMGLDLSAGDITALETRTEGWIAGLQFAALSMQSSEDVPSVFILQ